MKQLSTKLNLKSAKDNQNISLAAETISKIESQRHKFPPDKPESLIIPALFAAQEQNGGWLPIELIDSVADYLKVNKIKVREVATFYIMFELKPIGKYKFEICTNISCMLRGTEDLLKYLKNKLKDNDLFYIKPVECQGCCDGAPMMRFQNKFIENLTVEKLDQIIEECQV